MRPDGIAGDARETGSPNFKAADTFLEKDSAGSIVPSGGIQSSAVLDVNRIDQTSEDAFTISGNVLMRLKCTPRTSMPRLLRITMPLSG